MWSFKLEISIKHSKIAIFAIKISRGGHFYGAPVMIKGCLYVRPLMLKAKSSAKNTKSSTKLGTPCQVCHPVSDSQKKFKGGLCPLGVGVLTPEIFVVI